MGTEFYTNYSSITSLEKIKDCLNRCNEFKFSVSFIKKAGLILLTKEIEDALERGVVGELITSTYQNFTDIASLDFFFSLMSKYSNFKCHLDYQCFGDNGYHSKGFYFKMDDHEELIVGSTNITRFALLKNVEWNLLVSSFDSSNAIEDMQNEFSYLWNKTLILDKQLINNYQIQIDYAIEKWDMDYLDSKSNVIRPNTMQRKALKEIRRYRDMGQNRCLIISATGSGKTFLAGFDARNYDAKRLLFVVHRDAILKSAMDSFEKIFGSERSYGFYTGTKQELDRDFIFATTGMLSTHLDEFLENEFDYIIIDEAQHAVAAQTKNILNYFTPGFTLALTATPERMDNQDVFAMFDNNVPYELRLRDALLNDLIVPFHYYGIRDNLVDYSSNDKSKISREISRENNIDFIVKEIGYHRPDGKLKCLAFCTTIAHASLMADSFNDLGLHAVALTGNNDLGERIKAFNDLQDDNNELEIICSVDILNEGVDIPSVNMILFLRPTESSTIFIQQLGRGLRKYPGKEYVTVLDFIGNNYDRSVQIALALGSLNENNIVEKTLLKDLVLNDYEQLKLPIKIHIDSLAKEEVLHHLDNTNFNSKRFLVSDYTNFKKYVGHTPSYMDYLNNDCAPNIMRFIGIYHSYYEFLKIIGENEVELSNSQIDFVKYLSNLMPLIRPYEFIIVKSIFCGISEIDAIKTNCKIEFNSFSESQFDHALRLISNKLWENEYQNNRSEYVRNVLGTLSLVNVDMTAKFKEYLLDLLEYGLTRYKAEFGEFDTMFKKYGNYKTEQIKMAMGEAGLMQVQGTIVKPDGTILILAGLKKNASTLDHLNYVDKFISKSTFQWESTTNVTMTNSQGLKLINSKIAHIFIRKMEKEDGITLPYTYIGTGKLTNPVPGTKSKPTLVFQIKLDTEIPDYLRYDFGLEE